MIKVENVSFKYRDSNLILDNLSFNVYEGEILAIVGKNGSGKSTIGKLMSGIKQVKNGKIFIDNFDISKKENSDEIRNKIGIVFQNPENQIIFNNIHDELSFALKSLNEQEINIRIEQSLKQVGMLHFKDENLYNLSLGQKQRIMIAEILAKNPKYIILDEPTTMIDSLGKEKIYEIIKHLKSQGYTVICITNLADEILLADRILILDSGKIVAELKKDELIEKIDILKKYEIKVPTILEILGELKQKDFNFNIDEYKVSNVVSTISNLINQKGI